MLDLKSSAKLSDHSIVEVSPIVGDDPFGDTIAEDGVVFDEPGYLLFVTEENEGASTHFVK